MPHYYRQGLIPKKRHTVFRKKNGDLYHEELFGTEGFSGISSLIYHAFPPTMVKEGGKALRSTIAPLPDKQLRALSFKGFDLSTEDDYLDSRTVFLSNQDLNLLLAAPAISMKDYFFKNADADEMIFIHKGSGMLKTIFGKIDFTYGDYLIIPRGTIYQLKFNGRDNRLFILESFSPILTPKRYRNHFGQLLEHASFCERDYKLPDDLETHEERGAYKIIIKKRHMLYKYVYANHPFDAIGWDGYNYPYGISIFDFEPITGRIHMPPPVHQQFEGKNFVVCSFVPRLYDYHPQAIPAPYHHSNIDSDEVLYYVEGNFMSRNDICQGQITLHPAGIPHGPHPGTIEKSIGKKETKELAIMIDTFNPLRATEHALKYEVKGYYKSWLNKPKGK